MLLLRHQPQIAGPFLELVRSLRVLHLQPQQGFSSGSQGDSSNSANSSGDSEQSSPSGESLADSFHQRVAALQGGRSQDNINAWRNAGRQQQGASSSFAAHSSAIDATAASASASAASEAGGSDPGEGLVGAQVHPEFGYAVLGGVDPTASQQVAGQQQPKLHPTRNFKEKESYDPLDLSPLAQEEEEAWVPHFHRGPRPVRLSASEVVSELDYKNVDFLLNFVSASGRIKPRRQTRLKPRLQSRVARTVKLARSLALIPYEMRVGEGGEGDSWRRMREYHRNQTTTTSSANSS